MKLKGVEDRPSMLFSLSMRPALWKKESLCISVSMASNFWSEAWERGVRCTISDLKRFNSQAVAMVGQGGDGRLDL